MNTKFLEKEFDYLKPSTLEEALDILAKKQNVQIFAGGTDLIVKCKVGAPLEMDCMLDINGIPALFGAEFGKEETVIGAAEKIGVLERRDDLRRVYPALWESFQAMASVSVRNMATYGGNFCNASPVADPVGPAICYGGRVELRSLRGAREIAAEDFFLAPGVSVKEKDELLTRIFLPVPAPGTGAAFTKFGRVKADIAKISITVVLRREGDAVSGCRMAMGSVAAHPLFLKDISAGLVGRKMTMSLAEETGHAIADFIKPISDNHTTAEYRKDVAPVIARDTILTAWERTGGKIQ
jgi:carbon-monoxide dehydrogenase medium subunit